MTTTAPSADHIEALIAQLRRQHQQLVDLASAGKAEAMVALADVIDEIGANLLVADEELRIQKENLAESARRLDLLITAHEALFANATTAFVRTDTEGLIVRCNRAARRLLGLPSITRRCWTLASMVRVQDRPALRALVTRLCSSAQPPVDQLRLEATVVQPSGDRRPVVLSVRRSRDGEPGYQLLHWELVERVTRGPSAASGAPTASSPSAVQALAGAAAELSRQQTPTATLEHIVQQALEAVPGSDEVGITLMRSRRRIETPAATGRTAATCDDLQYRLGEGPCLTALQDGIPVMVTDMASEPRWPEFAPGATAAGVRSMLAVPLAARHGPTGALNFYAAEPRAFDADDELIGLAYATHAAIALASAQLEASLRAGIETRQEIGCAVGILMERHRIAASAAFDLLAQASQHANRKLRDIAVVVAETGEEPSAIAQRMRHSPSEAVPAEN